MEETRRCETAEEMWADMETVWAEGGTGPTDITLEMSETKHAFFYYTLQLSPEEQSAPSVVSAMPEKHPAE